MNNLTAKHRLNMPQSVGSKVDMISKNIPSKHMRLKGLEGQLSSHFDSLLAP